MAMATCTHSSTDTIRLGCARHVYYTSTTTDLVEPTVSCKAWHRVVTMLLCVALLSTSYVLVPPRIGQQCTTDLSLRALASQGVQRDPSQLTGMRTHSIETFPGHRHHMMGREKMAASFLTTRIHQAQGNSKDLPAEEVPNEQPQGGGDRRLGVWGKALSKSSGPVQWGQRFASTPLRSYPHHQPRPTFTPHSILFANGEPLELVFDIWRQWEIFPDL